MKFNGGLFLDIPPLVRFHGRLHVILTVADGFRLVLSMVLFHFGSSFMITLNYSELRHPLEMRERAQAHEAMLRLHPS
jgi:hypothetical protein